MKFKVCCLQQLSQKNETEFNDEMFYEFLKNDENKMIETISININKIFYNCDICDKQIEEPEIRYHKNGLNYDLCDECYQTNSENYDWPSD